MTAGIDRHHEIADLRRQLNEANETLRAIQRGEVDAVVVQGEAGHQVYTLQTADHPYRVLVQQMNEGTLMLSREGYILHANPRFTELVAASTEDLTSQDIRPWIAPEDGKQFEEFLQAAFDGQSQRLELSLIPRQTESMPAPSPVPVVVSLSPLNLTTMEAVCAVVTDLRERRHRETLERAEMMARSLMDHATAAVVITSLDGRIVRANAAAEVLSGRALIAEYFATAFPLIFDHSALGDAREMHPGPDGLAQLAAGGSSYRGIQAQMQAFDGQMVELQVSAGPFGPVDGEVQGAVFTLADVTRLRTSERRFRALAESIPQIVWTLDKTGSLDYLNTVGTDFFGMTARELAQKAYDAVHPDDRERARQLFMDAIGTGEPFHAEIRMVGASGEAHWFLVRAVPIRDINGQITQWFGTSTDLDDQKRTENDLRTANADLEYFAYAASHDFQEPLRMVTAYAQLLQKDFGRVLQGPASMYLQYVLEGTERLGALLQNLLAYISASRDIEEAPAEVDCNEVIREVISSLRIPIGQSGADVRYSELPRLRCPRMHLVEVFQNLVNNAIKYRRAEAPKVEIAANRVSGNWVFSVKDNGMGIARQHQENIFGVFKRLHGSDIPGSGIGLAICRRLVEQRHGRIWVESQLNEGSVFYFALPVAGMERTNANALA